MEQPRITFTQTTKSIAALARLQAMTGLSKADMINRALELYALVYEETELLGKELMLRGDAGILERIKML